MSLLNKIAKKDPAVVAEGSKIEVCVPELLLNETRRDWRAIPELAGPGQNYFYMVPLLGKIQEVNIDYS